MKKAVILFLAISFLFSCRKVKNETQKNSIPTAQKTIKLITSACNSDLKFSESDSLKFIKSQQPLETEAAIVVNPTKQFQTFLGIGGAITDASAETFATLPTAQQRKLLEAYYNPTTGIGYTLARTTIHSTDFSSESYTYVQEGDTALKTFSIDHDKLFRIPLIKRAIAQTGDKLTLFVSPWSPPAFMKTNNNMLQGGSLKSEFYQPWANYYVKFIKAYEKEGISVWGLTIQNEPMAKQTWESCIYTAEQERDFLKNNLGPTLQKEGLGNKKIIIWDHNRDLIFQRTNTVLNDSVAAKYVWGVGFHWYEDWKDGKPMFDNVARVQEAYPDKNLIFTEGTNERYDLAEINNPKLAERYGRSMINDFNNGTVGWTDWNILLDQTGGPNHVGNFCFAPVHADTNTGELTFTNSFYYIGHFSKYIRPGAKRVSSVSSSNELLTTAFLNTDGSLIVIAMNTKDTNISYTLSLNSEMTKVVAPAHGIQTVIIK